MLHGNLMGAGLCSSQATLADAGSLDFRDRERDWIDMRMSGWQGRTAYMTKTNKVPTSPITSVSPPCTQIPASAGRRPQMNKPGERHPSVTPPTMPSDRRLPKAFAAASALEMSIRGGWLEGTIAPKTMTLASLAK